MEGKNYEWLEILAEPPASCIPPIRLDDSTIQLGYGHERENHRLALEEIREIE